MRKIVLFILFLSVVMVGVPLNTSTFANHFKFQADYYMLSSTDDGTATTMTMDINLTNSGESVSDVSITIIAETDPITEYPPDTDVGTLLTQENRVVTATITVPNTEMIYFTDIIYLKIDYLDINGNLISEVVGSIPSDIPFN